MTKISSVNMSFCDEIRNIVVQILKTLCDKGFCRARNLCSTNQILRPAKSDKKMRVWSFLMPNKCATKNFPRKLCATQVSLCKETLKRSVGLKSSYSSRNVLQGSLRDWIIISQSPTSSLKALFHFHFFSHWFSYNPKFPHVSASPNAPNIPSSCFKFWDNVRFCSSSNWRMRGKRLSER